MYAGIAKQGGTRVFGEFDQRKNITILLSLQESFEETDPR
jgi:hypothetical protein